MHGHARWAAFKYLVQASHGDPNRSGFVYANLWLTSTNLLLGMAGGLLAPALPLLFTWRLQTLFLLSALLRISVFLLCFPRLIDLETTEQGRRWGAGTTIPNLSLEWPG